MAAEVISFFPGESDQAFARQRLKEFNSCDLGFAEVQPIFFRDGFDHISHAAATVAAVPNEQTDFVEFERFHRPGGLGKRPGRADADFHVRGAVGFSLKDGVIGSPGPGVEGLPGFGC